MSVRAKFQCRSVTDFGSQKQVKLDAVNGYPAQENASWSQATPCGELTMTITNPEAFSQFQPGKCYFLDFTPAE